ncbi:MAG: hypothetical protein KGJ89_04985 [Patescibacteria group bacterium]|nr:hypothetical protein [Patescibacteria group bacterium]MDE2227276.1 hypothetical protein [Patescibacteria group bacterium]
MSYHDANGKFVPDMDKYDKPVDIKTSTETQGHPSLPDKTPAKGTAQDK